MPLAGVVVSKDGGKTDRSYSNLHPTLYGHNKRLGSRSDLMQQNR